VGGAQTAEVPALHTAGKPLTDRGAGDIDELADDEVVGEDLGANRDHGIRGDAEFLDLPLRLDLGDRELAGALPWADTRSLRLPDPSWSAT